MKLSKTGMYLVNGTELVADGQDATAIVESKGGVKISKEAAKEKTIA